MKHTGENERLLEPERDSALTSPPVNPKVSPWYMIVPIFFVTLCIGASIAPMLQILTEIFCNEYYQSKQVINSTTVLFELPIDTNIPIEECSIPEVQALVSTAMAVIRVITSLSILLTAGWYGEESDFRGRLFVLRIAPIGMIIYTSMTIMVAKYQSVVGIIPIFIGPIIKGVLAGEHIVFAAFQAYISDATNPRDRTLYMSFMMASLYSGMTIGPIAGSWIIKLTGSLISVFYCNLAVDFLFFLYVLFFVPESNPFVGKHSNKRRKTISERLNIFSALHIIIRTRPRHANRYALWHMSLIMFFATIIAMPPTLLYAMLKFRWTAYEGGFFMSMSSFTRLIALVVVLPILNRIFKRPNQSRRRDILFDTWMMRIGYIVDAIGLGLMAIAPNSATFYGAGATQSLSMIAQPSAKSLLTVLVRPTEVGELLGAISVVDAVAGIVSQFSGNALYAASVKTMPSLTFYFCASVAILTSLTAFFVGPKASDDDNDEPDNTETGDAEPSNPIPSSTIIIQDDSNVNQDVENELL